MEAAETIIWKPKRQLLLTRLVRIATLRDQHEAAKSMSRKTKSQLFLTRLVQIATLWEDNESHNTQKDRGINAHFS